MTLIEETTARLNEQSPDGLSWLPCCPQIMVQKAILEIPVVIDMYEIKGEPDAFVRDLIISRMIYSLESRLSELYAIINKEPDWPVLLKGL